MSLALQAAVSRAAAVRGGGLVSGFASTSRQPPPPTGASGFSLGGLLGRVGRGIIGTVTGGPLAGLGGLLGGGGGNGGTVLPGIGPQGIPLAGPLAGAQRLIPGGATGLGAGCPSGFHPNKSDYFLRSGAHVAKGTRCVRNRRRNPLNPRAASRAISRIVSAKKATKMLGRVTVRSAVPHHHHKKK